jgi:hypothetical protein
MYEIKTKNKVASVGNTYCNLQKMHGTENLKYMQSGLKHVVSLRWGHAAGGAVG